MASQRIRKIDDFWAIGRSQFRGLGFLAVADQRLGIFHDEFDELLGIFDCFFDIGRVSRCTCIVRFVGMNLSRGDDGFQRHRIVHPRCRHWSAASIASFQRRQ